MTTRGSDNSRRGVEVTGNPTPEELAVVIALLSRQATAEPPVVPAQSLWARPLLREPLFPGPDAWLASAGPR